MAPADTRRAKPVHRRARLADRAGMIDSLPGFGATSGRARAQRFV